MSEFVFDLTDWELALEKRKPGDTVGAGYLLSLLSGEEEAREALTLLEEKKITLTLSDLPKYTGTGQGADRLAMEAQLVKQQDWIASLEENDPLASICRSWRRSPQQGIRICWRLSWKRETGRSCPDWQISCSALWLRRQRASQDTVCC